MEKRKNNIAWRYGNLLGLGKSLWSFSGVLIFFQETYLSYLRKTPGPQRMGNYTEVRVQWALTLAPDEDSFSLLPNIPIPPEDGWPFPSADKRPVSLLCLRQAHVLYKQRSPHTSTIQPISKDLISMRVSLELVFIKVILQAETEWNIWRYTWSLPTESKRGSSPCSTPCEWGRD